MKLLYSSLELLLALLGFVPLTSGSATLINLVVLMPNMTTRQLKQISDDRCPNLQHVAVEALLTAQTLREMFGWTVYNADDPLPGDLSTTQSDRSGRSVTLSMRLTDSKCSDTTATVAAMELYYSRSLSVLFGPCCTYALAPVGRHAKTWNIPVITTGGLRQGFGNHDDFPTLIRLIPQYRMLAEFLLKYILEKYKYRHFAALFHENYFRKNRGTSACGALVDVMEEILLQQKIQDFHWAETGQEFEEGHRPVKFHKEVFDESDTSRWNSTHALMDIRNNSRVVVLCASADSIRGIMLKAAELNFTNGEYVFVNIDLFSSGVRLEQPWYRADDTADNNARARQAYSPLMTVSLRKPSGARYENFSREVRRRGRVKRESTSSINDDSDEENSFVGAFHDAVLLYALALNETLADGRNAIDGAAITSRMWNRTFEGVTGNVSIDENGDRNAEYSLLDMNPDTGSFEVVANFYGNERRYEQVKPIYWGGETNEPPPDVPKCGFDGLGCPVNKAFPEYGIVIIVLGSLLFIVCLASLLVYRHYKLKAELAEVNWRVRCDDIMFGAQENRTLEQSNSRVSLFQTNGVARV